MRHLSLEVNLEYIHMDNGILFGPNYKRNVCQGNIFLLLYIIFISLHSLRKCLKKIEKFVSCYQLN